VFIWEPLMLKAKSSDFAKVAFLRYSLIHHTGLVRARGLKFAPMFYLSYYLYFLEKVPYRLINEAARGRQICYTVSKIGTPHRFLRYSLIHHTGLVRDRGLILALCVLPQLPLVVRGKGPLQVNK